MIEIIVQRMTEGNINPLQAVREIKAVLGKINSVSCKDGIKLTISDERNRHSVNQTGLNKQQKALLGEFAALAYLQAQADGSQRPGEVHLGKGLSTKHYAEGFKQYAGRVRQRYSVA